jgi:hypothetical protein
MNSIPHRWTIAAINRSGKVAPRGERFQVMKRLGLRIGPSIYPALSQVSFERPATGDWFGGADVHFWAGCCRLGLMTEELPVRTGLDPELPPTKVRFREPQFSAPPSQSPASAALILDGNPDSSQCRSRHR